MTAKIWTVRGLIEWMADDFAEKGVDSPRLDAELILAEAMGIKRVQLYLGLDETVEDAEALTRLRDLVSRRRKREPIAYILGRKEFYGREFRVNPSVLIPRPDTETLVATALGVSPIGIEDAVTEYDLTVMTPDLVVDAVVEEPLDEIVGETMVVLDEAVEEERLAIERAALVEESTFVPLDPLGVEAVMEAKPEDTSAAQPQQSMRVLDLCTGSGIVGLTIASERPTASVVLTDVSSAALSIAKENAQSLGVNDRTEFYCGDLFAALPKLPPFDVITANPPYIDDKGMKALAPDIAEHEPQLALHGGQNGFVLIKRIVDEASSYLRSGGALHMEIGFGQATQVAELMNAAGFGSVRSTKDLGRIERVVSGIRP